MYDVAIVGARCAGSALALRLARAGARVLLVDRTTFPSDTMSGHFLQPAGVSCLRRMGLAERLPALSCPPLRTMTVDFGGAILSGAPAPMADGTADAFAPRRFRFDAMLAGEAAAAGAELREATSFLEPVLVDDGVAGLRVSGPAGVETIRARLLVGADGRRSRVARLVGAADLHRSPAQTCAFYAYWEGADVPAPRLFVREGLFAVAIPCGGVTLLAVQWPHSRLAEIRADVIGATRAAIERTDWLADRFAGARMVDRPVGTGDLEAFLRAASGPGWALVGDAGAHKDPVSAQGMTDALLDAELLAEAALEGLGEGGDLEAALRRYGRRRDARTLPMHRLTQELAQLAPPPPEAQAALAAMAKDAAAVSQFLGVMAGSVPPQEPQAPAQAA